MKGKKTIFIVSLLFILLLPIPNQNNRVSENPNKPITKNMDPIVVVNNNSEFIGAGFTGSGSESQPYILENKVINGMFSHCIYISDTDAHFIIKNCILYNGSYGIYLDNASNGKIINVTSRNNQNSGILIYQGSNYINCYNNTLYDNKDYGIYLYGPNSEHCLIHNNTIYNNTRGIYVFQGADFNNFTDNTFYEHSQAAILLEISSNCTVSGNIAYNNDEGIATSNCNNNSFIDNYVHDNNDGIRLSTSDNNNISVNFIKNNVDTGIFLGQSDSNIISWNTIHENAVCINQTSSTGNNIFNNSCNLATLTEKSFSPSSGDTQTFFTYSVRYTDVENFAPTYIKVVINGISHDMVKLASSDNTYDDGCTYVYTTTLPAGSLHSHYFEAGDMMDTTRTPATGEDLGPSVQPAPIPGFTWIYGLLSIFFIFGIILALNRKKPLINI
ncbi:MAG: hypothetical protein GF329_18770 [Candidatus Lokiarchaeota archaeon]|nr:hypothetical protein [Candidatus Lokiarchaeota archaeon]